MSDTIKVEKRKEERNLVEKSVTLSAESEMHFARSVNVSAEGMKIVTEAPVGIQLQIVEDDDVVTYDAQLIWAQMNEDGCMEYGLKYNSK